MSYRLHDAGYPTFKKILHGRKWVGRVCKVQDGYLGIINISGGSKVEFKASTEVEAFEEVVARHLGHPSAAALRQQNSTVRAHNRAASARGRELGRRFVNSDHAGQMRILDELLKGLK